MPVLAHQSHPGRIREAVVVATAYFASAAITLMLTRFDGGLAVVWVAGALLFAKLSATPRRRWWPLTSACLPAGIAAAALFGFGHGVALPMALISLTEAIGAAWLLKRVCGRFGRFQSVTEVTRFLGIAGVLAPAMGATLGAWCAHIVSGLPYWFAWRDWYAGHALGFVAFAPPLVLAMRGEMSQWARSVGKGGRREALGLLGAVVLACGITFGQNKIPLVVVPFVPMIAATFRLGRFGAVASILVLVSVGLACSLAGLGPTSLLRGSMTLKLQILQIYFATVVLVLLPVAAELKARRRLLDRLRSAEALHRLVLDRTSDIVLRLGSDHRVRYASPSVARAWGYEPEELIGQSKLDFVLADDAPAVMDARRTALASPDDTAAVEFRVSRKDGSLVWVESHMRATVDEDGRATGTVSIVREVTERRRLVEDLARKATTDPLTGLCNRRAFDEALAAQLDPAIGAGRGGCLAIFDLDHFKRINDRFGHAAGDAVLVRFATLLRAAVRDGDLVARLGGEEFAVLLTGATVEQARLVCERIRVRLASSEERSISGAIIHATVSAGIALLSTGDRPEQVVAAADAALYRAKEEGRNRLALAA